jgi:uncharacterized membrane protein
MTLFAGTGVLCVLAAIAAVVTGGGPRPVPVIVGAALYLVGSIVITGTYHVPRNDLLATWNPADPAALADWPGWLRAWVAGNHARTVSSLAAAVCLTLGLR